MSERGYPVELLRAERSEFRLISGHVKRDFFNEQTDRIRAGYKGELSVDQYLVHANLPCWWRVLRDVRLRINDDYIVQFDTLVFTERGIWIIEAKMIRGTLEWKEFPRRMERVRDDGSILTFDCPIIQVENQKVVLRGWLQSRNLDMPVNGVVGFATRNTWVNLPDNFTILSVKELPSFLNAQVRNSRFSAVETGVRAFDSIRFAQLGPDETPSSERQGLTSRDFLHGLICESCRGRLKRGTQRSYTCLSCGQPDPDEPIARALLDYVLTIRPVVTTKEFTRFAQIVPEATARRCLNRHLSPVGWGPNAAFAFYPGHHLDSTRLKKRQPG
ncbi:nuclease-related domain-containing protein [Bhargavaea cecembensis]|uniref:nuclease-related domain-containing protein n=1 Tax=Bhargavaea cecembensis TaxID=394098 RepID=UPI00058BBE29|nr:nuclease-related domain-containing protein [Bhargavaea cecembensis]